MDHPDIRDLGLHRVIWTKWSFKLVFYHWKQQSNLYKWDRGNPNSEEHVNVRFQLEVIQKSDQKERKYHEISHMFIGAGCRDRLLLPKIPDLHVTWYLIGYSKVNF